MMFRLNPGAYHPQRVTFVLAEAVFETADYFIGI
jgi:hypothetical protein